MKTTARIFKALSDETRLRILALLAGGELCVCDLMTTLELPQSTVSRHLAFLRNAGLVEDRRQGVWMFYRLIDGADPVLGDFLKGLPGRLAGTPQGRSDQDALRVQQAQKDKNSCA